MRHEGLQGLGPESCDGRLKGRYLLQSPVERRVGHPQQRGRNDLVFPDDVRHLIEVAVTVAQELQHPLENARHGRHGQVVPVEVGDQQILKRPAFVS